ncbi:MAG: SdiA-regulated domain-containing protein [Flavobacteriales bacterium]|nr:SdiA-regulated domain-containing protein [Flavobacteriales bacterium]
MRCVLTLTALLLPFAMPGQRAAMPMPYDLRHPAQVITLPDRLMEVSALTDVDQGTVACVQDEAATLYFIGLKEGRVLRTEVFDGPGDMEGLTRVRDCYLALRSDGLIHRLRLLGGRWSSVDTFRLDLPHRNIEGLGFDDSTGMVLVAPKDIAKGGPDVRDVRVVHAFDPDDPLHRCVPMVELSVAALVRQALALGLPIPERVTQQGRTVPALKLRLSSVAAHPRSGHFYLLSAVDRTLTVVDREGRLVDLAVLDADVLPKPEGITFLPDGELVLSSEGQGRTPVIARFPMQVRE